MDKSDNAVNDFDNRSADLSDVTEIFTSTRKVLSGGFYGQDLQEFFLPQRTGSACNPLQNFVSRISEWWLESFNAIYEATISEINSVTLRKCK